MYVYIPLLSSFQRCLTEDGIFSHLCIWKPLHNPVIWKGDGRGKWRGGREGEREGGRREGGGREGEREEGERERGGRVEEGGAEEGEGTAEASTDFLMCMVRYLLMALSGMKVHTMQLRVCQMDSTPGESTSSFPTPAVCLISWQKT